MCGLGVSTPCFVQAGALHDCNPGDPGNRIDCSGPVQGLLVSEDLIGLSESSKRVCVASGHLGGCG